MAMEQNLQSMQDTQRRALLLRAQAGAMRRQQRELQDPMQRLQNQLKRLQDIERWASGVQGVPQEGNAELRPRGFRGRVLLHHPTQLRALKQALLMGL